MNWNLASAQDQAHFDPAQAFAAGLALHNIANTAYPIGHLTTMRPYRVPRSQVQQVAPQAWAKVDHLGLYVHVPFCEARCGFCEYTVIDPQTNCANEETYFDLLLQEFELYRQALDTPHKTLFGFDIGGGTPSWPEARQIERVVQAARHNFRLPEQVTISIETTPKIAANQPEKISAYYEMGIRRISMGVQTVNPRLLEAVGRRVSSLDYNRRATEKIRAAGFERFNIDIMYGFAHQTLQTVEATIHHVIDLQPEYVTLYRMRYKGTRLADQARNVSLKDVVTQARLAKEMLLAAGYHGTPGKNTFSRVPGDVGTSDYLTKRVIHGAPYLGLGLGAQSLSEKTLAYNSGAADKRLAHYQKQVQAGQLPIQDLYHLSPPAAIGKMISVSFYFGEIDLVSFQRKFGSPLEQVFPEEVSFVSGEGLMEYCAEEGNNTLRLTSWGEQNINGVIALFYAGAVKAYLLSLANGLDFPAPFDCGSIIADVPPLPIRVG
jgi:oxygen-independent coproporphyrinogen-3 oxidase